MKLNICVAWRFNSETIKTMSSSNGNINSYKNKLILFER